MKNNNGFTLIELLAVIVIFALTFLFIIPEMTSLINKGNDTTKKLIEEKVITATKDYVANNKDAFINLVNVGDVVYVSKNDLLDSKLIDEEEISDLDNFSSVKCELEENDNIKYSILYE